MRASAESFANGWSSGSGGRVFQASYSSDALSHAAGVLPK